MDAAAPDQPRRTRVAVVFGGRSSEHEVSCVSAGCVLSALDPGRYDVVPVGITREGRWVLQEADPGRLRAVDGRLPQVDAAGAAVVLAADPTARGLRVADASRVPGELGAVDVVFPLLHGPWGEDGTLQGLLELAAVPYVGSGVLASALAMDKGHMKVSLAAAGLPVGPYTVLTDRDWRADRAGCLERAAALGGALFVKPARAGSSVGISRVERAEGPGALAAAVEAARAHDPRVVVEAAVEGAREVECGVLAGADGAPAASVCAEIRVRAGHAFYDFAAKYLDDSADLVVPADLPGDVAGRVRAMAVAAFDALGCEGLARVDFFVGADGAVLVNEVNTMPGFTPVSMFPRMWAASGVDYPTLVDRLVADALRRGTGLR